ncbi:hypothetical protein C5F52_27245 [Limnohabitans sp. TS-CS-82]|uniref:hypothetical protein n=1 Tax=Limnohabitans sp. TS-CS-82 TaxID=2094193 RepID=UPI000CF1F97D|nr:hypothetical protein [Limnohabitans sp. TS-CS-82]PQA80070.1 hypothetical protein C5F52_27245 [Limnohabitans sp. TS-CS-82]
MPAVFKKVHHRLVEILAAILLCQRLSTNIADFLSTMLGCGCATGLRLTEVDERKEDLRLSWICCRVGFIFLTDTNIHTLARQMGTSMAAGKPA